MQPEEMPYFVGTVAAIFQNPSNFTKCFWYTSVKPQLITVKRDCSHRKFRRYSRK